MKNRASVTHMCTVFFGNVEIFDVIDIFNKIFIWTFLHNNFKIYVYRYNRSVCTLYVLYLSFVNNNTNRNIDVEKPI